ncbi:SurA N-terminal domain-containing protein [Paucibacter sp. Y2R2-4]|uniref:SurA N-terminal domain-containing protein n=1 Tax=Paucibacter sp. Y2R2-4 TaxID=2893553 RepID=UPI0021E4E21C|nr:SurA N-terminal domain-containing protein [Paucibacter sp. Y2R2-4]MCV2348636.1 SurA N-terminal domain-containing protein [Paucibacter sp. Y2R2-4]
MFEFVRKHNRLFQLILLILILPSFALVGMQGYTSFMDSSNAGVASVNGRKITQVEWDAAHRQQVDRMRQQMPNLDAKLFDSPEVRREALDGLVRERVMQAAAAEQHLMVSDERLNVIFRNDPQFAFLRNPDGTLNKGLIAAQGMSSQMFLERLRQDLTLRQVTAGVGGSAIASSANSAVAFDALLQQREVQMQRFDAKDFIANIQPTEAQIEAFYKDSANAAQFQKPEAAQIQYVVLDLEALKSGVSFTEDDLRKYYAENASRYSVAEERRASHILIKAEKSASAEARSKAKAQAEELLVQARKTPAAFAELARKNSQDEGSAANGGDLDFFGRGAMTKVFEDAAFALKQGEISNVVESEYGYHLIQLTGVRGGDKKSFEAVRPEIEAEVRKQLAQRRYSEVAEQFSNLVYEQSDSLQPAADKLKLTVQTATVQRTPQAGVTGPLASVKLLDSVFGNESLRNKRNTEALETAPSQMTAARVVEHKPSHLQPLAEVHDKVRAQLLRQLATAEAVKAGQARLAALQKGGDDAGLSAPTVVSRALARELPRKVLDAILVADASKLPSVIGLDAGDGVYVVARLSKVLPRDPAVVDAKRAAEQYAQAWNGAEAEAFIGALKARFKVSVKAPASAASASL